MISVTKIKESAKLTRHEIHISFDQAHNFYERFIFCMVQFLDLLVQRFPVFDHFPLRFMQAFGQEPILQESV